MNCESAHVSESWRRSDCAESLLALFFCGECGVSGAELVGKSSQCEDIWTSSFLSLCMCTLILAGCVCAGSQSSSSFVLKVLV